MLRGHAGLAENVGESSLGQSSVQGHNGAKGSVGRFSFKGDMATFLAQLNEACALQSANESLTGNARQFWHLPGDFDNRPEWLMLESFFRGAVPSFKVELDRFAKIRTSSFDILVL